MKEWDIGLAPYIIADGAYRNFLRGEIAEFALEFHPQSGQTTQTTEKSIELIGDCHYKAVAEVVFYSEKVWVLDFGLCAFNDSRISPAAELGDFVEIEFHLGIDPFPYFERHYKWPDMLPLIYTWQVDKIIAQSAPLVGKWNAVGHRWYEPDESNYSYRELEQTGGKKYKNEEEAMHDYYTASLHYILNCTQMDVAPKFQRTK